MTLLTEHGFRISMGRRGNPYDNAQAESFLKTLKAEEVHLCEYRTFEEANERIERFIEEVYNRKRLHSALGYQSPEEFELALNATSGRSATITPILSSLRGALQSGRVCGRGSVVYSL